MNNKLPILIIAFVLLSSGTHVISKSCSLSNCEFKSEEKIIANEYTSEKYAVIMVGRFFGSIYDIPTLHEKHYKWYLNDAARFYNMLKNTFGYDDDHIFLLVKLLPLPMPEEFKVVKDLIDYESSKLNLELVLSKFQPGGSNELDEDDSLVILLINHGGVYADSYGNDGGISWLSPNIFDGSSWDFEQYSYDDNLNTCAIFDEGNTDYSDWMTLMLDNPIKLRGFRIQANNYVVNDESNDPKNVYDELKLEFYKGNTLVKTTSLGFWATQGWQYQRFEGDDSDLPTADKVKIRFNGNNEVFKGFVRYPAKVFEFDFWPAASGYDMTKVYMGCPFLTIPDFLRHFYDDTDTEKIYDTELASFVSNIKAKMTFFLQPCFSGAFIDDLSGENRVICTASRGSEPADSWIGFMREALNFEVDADYNKDGAISILEAYEYTAKKDDDKYGDLFHPLIDDDGRYPGHYYNEPGYGLSDGKLAAQTFLGNKEGNAPKTGLFRMLPFVLLREFFSKHSLEFPLIRTLIKRHI